MQSGRFKKRQFVANNAGGFLDQVLVAEQPQRNGVVVEAGGVHVALEDKGEARMFQNIPRER
eukprot:6267617-Heterocapsa_arctica.AAC.1